MVTEGRVTFFIHRYRIAAGEVGVVVRGPRHPAQRRQAEKFLAWCDKNQVDPILYLDDVLLASQQKRMTFPPISRMRSKRLLEGHRAVGADRVYAKRSLDNIEEIDTRIVEKKLRIHQEKFKSFYEGREEQCARYQEYTGGFNPMSRFCAKCPQTSSCIELARAV